MSARKYHFTLTKAQADALLDLTEHLYPYIRNGSHLDRAGIALDEQMSMQDSPWERCERCKGSGWVEGQ